MNDDPFIRPFREAGLATAEAGHVVLDGPDGVAITARPRPLTPPGAA